ncbi:DUF6550 family protein [Pygmaiobacter massiliensis]|uniref:DUF6550 family protein n=1 Tax=Pygmaiobacter massiliensis TaxID=1917873 RepID=UPI000C7AB5F0|nr:DUF6550 family protein [Pygmaiobacter massiliensis]
MRKLWTFALILLFLTFASYQAVLTNNSPIRSSVQTVQVPIEEDVSADTEVSVERVTELPKKEFPDASEQVPEEASQSSEPSLPEEVAVPATTPEPVQTPHSEPIQPEDGAIRQDGAIYVPGFGWIPDSGEENVCIIAPHAGTGKIVGEM